MILVDTNILLRLAQPGHPHYQAALDAIEMLRLRDNEEFVICPQNLYEMYVVCSRPIKANGLGMAPQQAHVEIANIRGVFQVLPETERVYSAWEGLIAKYAIVGKRAHDARLVAMMIEHHVPRLLTFNDIDFKQFAEIKAFSPFDVLNISRV